MILKKSCRKTLISRWDLTGSVRHKEYMASLSFIIWSKNTRKQDLISFFLTHPANGGHAFKDVAVTEGNATTPSVLAHSGWCLT